MRLKRGWSLVLLTLLLIAQPLFAKALPVGDFFKDPDFSGVSLSPQGDYITVARRVENRAIMKTIRLADMKETSSIEYGDRSNIDRVVWVGDDRFLAYVSYREGRFDVIGTMARVFAANVDGSQRIEIPNGATFNLVDTTPDDPQTVLVERSAPDAYLFKLNVYTGRTTTAAMAPLRPGRFLVDRQGNVRYAIGNKEGTRSYVLRREGNDWKEVSSAEMGEASRSPVGFAADGKSAYFTVSDKGEPDRLVTIDPETGKETVLIPAQTVDPDGFVRSSDRSRILMAHYSDGFPEYKIVDKTHPESQTYAGLINSFRDQDRAVIFRGISRDGSKILMNVYSDTDPGSYYLFDRNTRQATFLLSSMDWIKPEQMSETTPISYKARDGVTIHGYLTLPKGVEHRNLPLILHPHGGPHGPRDNWGFNPEVQFLANLGYAVLQVNFRGSGGYGNAFERMGYRNWGLKMIDDMTDGVRWTVGQGFADPAREIGRAHV